MMNDPLQLDEKPAPMPDHPASYPKRILLAVTGKTPQIVTETLWALAMDSEQPFVPTQIRLLTTEEGRRHAVEKLLNPESGAFHALCRDWKLGPIDFDAACIQVLSREGQPVEDIVSPHDNEITADQICAWVKEATRDPQSAVHVSLAGGRKTMGYYAGYALSLFGRDQDRLSHVLVDERYERMREFYYPTPEPCTLFSPTANCRPTLRRPGSTSPASLSCASPTFCPRAFAPGRRASPKPWRKPRRRWQSPSYASTTTDATSCVAAGGCTCHPACLPCTPGWRDEGSNGERLRA